MTGRGAIPALTPGVEKLPTRLLNSLHDATWSSRTTSLLVVLLGVVLGRWKTPEREQRGSRNWFADGDTWVLRGASRRA